MEPTDGPLRPSASLFASNFPTAGVQPNNAIFDVVEPEGSFTLNWLSNSGWEVSSSGGVTWNNLNNYVPAAPGTATFSRAWARSATWRTGLLHTRGRSCPPPASSPASQMAEFRSSARRRIPRWVICSILPLRATPPCWMSPPRLSWNRDRARLSRLAWA